MNLKATPAIVNLEAFNPVNKLEYLNVFDICLQARAFYTITQLSGSNTGYVWDTSVYNRPDEPLITYILLTLLKLI